MMNRTAYLTLAAAAAAVALSTSAIADETPISSDGSVGIFPLPEGAVRIAPSRGASIVRQQDIEAQGAESAPETAFPANGMATVAYGKIGKTGESIINWDSRTRSYTTSYPSRAIVFIEYNGAHLCTGWLYAANMIATSGHCLHTGGTGGTWRNRTLYRIYAGRDGSSSPFGSCTVARMHSVVGWVTNGDANYDYGAMRLNCTIGNTVGWFGMYNLASPLNQAAIIGGYPGDKARQNWTSADKIRAATTTMFGYRMDTVGGHSGSPIWHDRSDGLSADGAWAVAVHGYGVGAIGTNMNGAVRLTSGRITNYVNWRNLP